MILSGEKKEEYREIKEYYQTRFENEFKNDYRAVIKFRNGYSNSSPSFDALCELDVGKGKPEWGAEPDKEYYVLKIIMIYQKYNC